MQPANLAIDRQPDGVWIVTLNRPDKRNAMSDDMRTEFIHALEQVSADKAIKAVVLPETG